MENDPESKPVRKEAHGSTRINHYLRCYQADLQEVTSYYQPVSNTETESVTRAQEIGGDPPKSKPPSDKSLEWSEMGLKSPVREGFKPSASL